MGHEGMHGSVTTEDPNTGVYYYASNGTVEQYGKTGLLAKLAQ